MKVAEEMRMVYLAHIGLKDHYLLESQIVHKR